MAVALQQGDHLNWWGRQRPAGEALEHGHALHQARGPLQLCLLGLDQLAALLAVAEVVLQFLFGFVEVLQQPSGFLPRLLEIVLVALEARLKQADLFLQALLLLGHRLPLTQAAEFDPGLAGTGLGQLPLGVLQALQLLFQPLQGESQLLIAVEEGTALVLELGAELLALAVAVAQALLEVVEAGLEIVELLVAAGESLAFVCELGAEFVAAGLQVMQLLIVGKKQAIALP